MVPVHKITFDINYPLCGLKIKMKESDLRQSG